jgi:hypothetical protein
MGEKSIPWKKLAPGGEDPLQALPFFLEFTTRGQSSPQGVKSKHLRLAQASWSSAGLPDGLFSNQKPQFWYILEGS